MKKVLANFPSFGDFLYSLLFYFFAQKRVVNIKISCIFTKNKIMKIDLIQVIGMIIFIGFSFFWIGYEYHKNKTK